MASIHVIQGPDKGRAYRLNDGANVIGRQGSSVVLSDVAVSRSHARVSLQDGRWLLDDMGSANGTFLNGMKLTQPAPVRRGDQIRCGTSLLVFLGGHEADPSPMELDVSEKRVDAAIVATVPSNEDSVIIPSPEAGARAIGNLRILYDLIAEVGSIFNIDLLLTRTLDKVFGIVPGDRGFILLIDENGTLQVKASRLADEPPKGRQRKETPISRTIVNEVVSKQVGILSSNAMTDKRFTSGKSVHNLGIRSAICVPIKGRDRVLGVIHVDSSVVRQTYTTEQLRILTAVGYQTGLAIENVRLYEAAVQSERLAATGETVAILSHHIKNILQAMTAGADVVEMGLDRGNIEKARGAWPIVQRNLRRINDLILNMLTFSKDREPQLESLDVNKILGEVLDLESPLADEREIALIRDLDPLPNIPADEAGLHQAFLNLVSNALDAVQQHSGAVTVSSKHDSMNRRVIVQVADNGKGIDPKDLPNIFTPFFSNKGQGGTGLGLAVTKKVIEEHQGSISVTSTPGEGTTFTVSLPVTQ